MTEVPPPLRRRMSARDPSEEHRAATPLELLFDLCFVVAVAQAAAQLHHGLAEGHPGPYVLGYLMVFFAIWWAWMNFTWFASAYDTDDVPYRLLTLVQIAGVLVLAAGVPDTFHHYDFTLVTVGYVIMRLAMVVQWLRASAEHPETRTITNRYAVGIAVVQAGWLLRLLLPESPGVIGFFVLALAEISVPVWAERGRPTSWHPGHIAERYGLFTIIVIGEVVLASMNAVQSAIGDTGISGGLLATAGGGLLLIFGMWWAYFKRPAEEALALSPESAFRWGYGHFAVFASAAGVGAGLGVAIDGISGEAPIGPVYEAFCVAVPVAAYLVSLALVHERVGEGAATLVRALGAAAL
ncbi:MAG: low temperature requirement protein A, partial [Micromonosporaceae bacterium]